MQSITSYNLKHGISLDHPEAIPVTPLSINNGTIGYNYTGSIY